jgi:SAM-dependent methyltransferase
VRPAIQCAFSELSADMVGFWKTEIIAAAVKLNIIEALPGRLKAIAAAYSIPYRKLNRVLNALGEMGIVRMNSTLSEWELTAKGRFLKQDHPKTLADAALEYAGPLQQAWKSLPAAILREDYCPPDIFQIVANDERRKHTHHRMLRSYALHDYEELVPFLPIRPGERVVDAGGGSGILAEMIKAHFNDIEIAVFDLPEIARLVGRNIQSCGGDFFRKWPITADVIILARVLHDWNDDKALLILQTARKALSHGGRLVVVEMIFSESGYNGSLCDLHLLVESGGTQRTREQFRRLLEEAGFDASFILETHSPSIIIGNPK